MTPEESAKVTAQSLERYRAGIEHNARAAHIEPSLIAAIISRETSALKRYCEPPPVGQLGDNGYGHGPGQIDRRYHAEWCEAWRAGKLTPDDGVAKCVAVFCEQLRALADISAGDHLTRCAVASYNCGPSRVMQALKVGVDPDRFTTGRDYSADVLARAAWLKAHGWER